MISRRSALATAQLFEFTFRYYAGSSYYSRTRELYDFLFEREYQAWFCNLARAVGTSSRGVKEFVMQVHTGETLASATKSWSWEQREALGQRYLADLARGHPWVLSGQPTKQLFPRNRQGHKGPSRVT